MTNPIIVRNEHPYNNLEGSRTRKIDEITLEVNSRLRNVQERLFRDYIIGACSECGADIAVVEDEQERRGLLRRSYSARVSLYRIK